MLITKKSTALLTKLEANSSGQMYTSSIMVLRQTISDKMVNTQTYMEFKNGYNFAETYEKHWLQLFIKRYIIETNAS